MSYEQDQSDRIRDRLRKAINTVPKRVTNGNVQDTRAWLEVRAEAEKMLNKKAASVPQLLAMISRVEE